MQLASHWRIFLYSRAPTPLSPIEDFWVGCTIRQSGLASGIAVNNINFDRFTDFHIRDGSKHWSDPCSTVRDDRAFVQFIRVNAGVGDSIGSCNISLDLFRRCSQFLPLQISGYSAANCGEHDNNSRSCENPISSGLRSEPIPSVSNFFPPSGRISPTPYDIAFGIIVCVGGALLCAICIVLIIGGIQNPGLFLLAMLSFVGAAYLISHGMFLASLGQWSAP